MLRESTPLLSHGVRRAVVTALCAAGLVLATVFLGAAAASAHAVLVSSDPGYGAMVDHAPARVSITFDEPVTAAQNAVTVADRDGARADDGSPATADGGRTVVVPLRPGLSDGTYLLGWSLLSADGHVVAGSIVFGIGVPPDLTVTAAPPDPLIATLDTVVRLLTALGYLGIALAVGIPLAVRLIWTEAAHSRAITQLTRVGAAAVSGTALAAFALIPGRLGGAAGWGEPRTWIQSAISLAGAVLLAKAMGAIALAYAATASSRRAGSIMAVSGTVVVLAQAASGHAAAGEYRWAAVVSTVLHVVAMAVWVGGVMVVVLAWRTSRRVRVVARFGSVAAGAVAALAVSGVFQAWRAVSPVAALWSTSWGLLLIAKLSLVAVALGVAVAVRRWAAGNRRRESVGMSWVVRAELGAQVAVLVVTALLTGVAPARDTYDPAVALDVPVGALTAHVNIDGAHAGPQKITVRLKDSAGLPRGALEVTGRLERDGGGIGPVEVVFRRVEPVEIGPDYFVSRPVRVPVAGEWRLRLTVVADRVSGYAATVPYRVW
ncbi:copper resistance protein CopC [Nocardia sp. NPDC059240]|uniref:copper resistance CopC/CopD family protein n=1 Tax=Nocardia sp. NPDC059240 TaxID=3346786 RepID=UPI0036B9AC22